MNVNFSMGVHRTPRGAVQVILVGTVATAADAKELQDWLMAALKEKATGAKVSKGGIILPTTMTDAKEVE